MTLPSTQGLNAELTDERRSKRGRLLRELKELPRVVLLTVLCFFGQISSRHGSFFSDFPARLACALTQQAPAPEVALWLIHVLTEEVKAERRFPPLQTIGAYSRKVAVVVVVFVVIIIITAIIFILTITIVVAIIITIVITIAIIIIISSSNVIITITTITIIIIISSSNVIITITTITTITIMTMIITTIIIMTIILTSIMISIMVSIMIGIMIGFMIELTIVRGQPLNS
ncbi:hypothetical protein AK812_SmicGene34148 [Symbiodinium microadriaticum]|uniref:Uncharacterized protein n=1 Tax=Symbiodinium microadriaticum TaxID=2951 RepID=A0A1Q9CPS8_SYMMI|nr:hypothetical protein AK812_SmicGene34148 [Symbiodinium microadriaticum]